MDKAKNGKDNVYEEMDSKDKQDRKGKGKDIRQTKRGQIGRIK